MMSTSSSSSSSSSLEQLQAEIQAWGDAVRALKSRGDADPAEIQQAVQQLLAAKQRYADHPDRPVVVETDESSSSKKKAQTGPAKQESDPNSANAQKKAAKKAAKKALKAAAPPADATPTVATPDTAAATVPPVVTKTTPASSALSTPPTPGLTANSYMASATTTNTLLPGQVSINPNQPLRQRPVIALTVAVLTQTEVDLELLSDHKAALPAMGLLPIISSLSSSSTSSSTTTNNSSNNNNNNASSGTAVVVGDVAMARYLARRATTHLTTLPGTPGPQQRGRSHLISTLLSGHNPAEAARIDAWVDYALSLHRLPEEQRIIAAALSLEHALVTTTTTMPVTKSLTSSAVVAAPTYLVGHGLTLADLCMFQACNFPTPSLEWDRLATLWPAGATAAWRWVAMMRNHPSGRHATQMCLGIANNGEAILDPTLALDPLVAGMNVLEGGVPTHVVTRFPPEPSGYLHIGHAKAVLLNDYYATRYQGRLIVRFDDTNPSKEKEEFQESIVADLAKLGVQPDLVTYTSDYFTVMEGYAKVLMAQGLAYMDDTPQEQMKAERAERIESKHRQQQTPEQALQYFQLMCSGSVEGSVWCLRAKMDMKSDNGTMRDPVLYRQNLTPHHRSGTTFKAYPTYDLACPIVDSLEGVTHALRTTEYNDRDEQYQWLLQALGLRRVRIHAFSRVNFKNTLLSKRKLTWFVEHGYVTGWDDARMPTIRGVRRSGVDITALKNFMYAQGASRRVVLMDWMVFWSENKKEIDKKAQRYMAIDRHDHVQLIILEAPTEADMAFVETTLHPKDPSMGKRAVRLCNEVLLETADVEGIQVGEEMVLLRWGVVRITQVLNDPAGVTQLQGELVPDGDFRAAKRKLSWIAQVSNNTPVILTEFDNLIIKDKLEEEDDFQQFINPNTKATTEVIGDAGLKMLREDDIIQLERRGYYRVDRPYINASKPLILYMIPDGKSKAMSGQAGKLAHR